MKLDCASLLIAYLAWKIKNNSAEIRKDHGHPKASDIYIYLVLVSIISIQDHYNGV